MLVELSFEMDSFSSYTLAKASTTTITTNKIY